MSSAISRLFENETHFTSCQVCVVLLMDDYYTFQDGTLFWEGRIAKKREEEKKGLLG